MDLGAKELATYAPIADQGAVCVWETDNVENLMPLLAQLASCGVKTEIIPVETADVTTKKWEERAHYLWFHSIATPV